MQSNNIENPDQPLYDITLSGSNALISILQNAGQPIIKPFTNDIFLLMTPVVGMQYQKLICKLVQPLNEQDLVYLVREPENEHDPKAIAVCNEDGKRLGYVPKMKNEILANLMDGGKELKAQIKKLEKGSRKNPVGQFMVIDIYMVD